MLHQIIGEHLDTFLGAAAEAGAGAGLLGRRRASECSSLCQGARPAPAWAMPDTVHVDDALCGGGESTRSSTSDFDRMASGSVVARLFVRRSDML